MVVGVEVVVVVVVVAVVVVVVDEAVVVGCGLGEVEVIVGLIGVVEVSSRMAGAKRGVLGTKIALLSIE